VEPFPINSIPDLFKTSFTRFPGGEEQRLFDPML
jgi:hypothetical protein